VHIQSLGGTYDWVWCTHFGCEGKPNGTLVLATPLDDQPGITGTAYYGNWPRARVSLDRTAVDSADVGTQWGLRLAFPAGTKRAYAPAETEHYLFVSATRDDAGLPFVEMHFNRGYSGNVQTCLYVVGKRRAEGEAYARISEAEKRRLGIGLYTRKNRRGGEDVPEDAEFLEDQDVDEESSDDEDMDYPEDSDDEPSTEGDEPTVTITSNPFATASANHARAAALFSSAFENRNSTSSQPPVALKDARVAKSATAGNAPTFKVDIASNSRDARSTVVSLSTSNHSLALNGSRRAFTQHEGP
jgi:hypothetical protein